MTNRTAAEAALSWRKDMPLNRTDDWSRLGHSTIATVIDEPGRISVSAVSPVRKRLNLLRLMFIGVAVIMMLLNPVLGLAVIIPGTVFLMTVGVMLIQGYGNLNQFADRVVFTPERISFYRGSHEMGSLARNGMQQIVIDKEKTGLAYHRFLSDVGYVSAFAATDESDLLLLNNLLMAAFAQPLHLDGMAGPMREVVDAAPQVVGLR